MIFANNHNAGYDLVLVGEGRRINLDAVAEFRSQMPRW